MNKDDSTASQGSEETKPEGQTSSVESVKSEESSASDNATKVADQNAEAAKSEAA